VIQRVIMRAIRHPLWCQVSTYHARHDPAYRAALYRYKRQRGSTWLIRGEESDNRRN
jgi:hypothetical protein